MELLFNNLLKNAFEAARSVSSTENPDGYVSLSAARTRESVVVTIENTGPKLTPEDLERVTEPFATSKETGLGLGIPIAMALAVAAGGHIDFAIRETGGLVARVTLPYCDEARQSGTANAVLDNDAKKTSEKDAREEGTEELQ